MRESNPIEVELRVELLQAALDSLDEGMAVLDADSRVVYWNSAALAITGYAGADLIGRPCPTGFYQIDAHHHSLQELRSEFGQVVVIGAAERPVLVQLRHRRGHTLPAMLRRVALRDALGARFGTLLRFHPSEEVDALPHGETGEGVGIERSQADLEDRLDSSWREWTGDGVPFGLLWITVDQSNTMRKTHGRDACEAMLAIVERTLLHGLRPTEILGRWGNNEFLVLSHERTAEMLAMHARRLGGLARTAEFRWWGDRVSLTVSIGAAQAEAGISLACLLQNAKKAMETSVYTGGNHVTVHHNGESQDTEPGGQECSQL